jgi:hypothetical protein
MTAKRHRETLGGGQDAGGIVRADRKKSGDRREVSRPPGELLLSRAIISQEVHGRCHVGDSAGRRTLRGAGQDRTPPKNEMTAPGQGMRPLFIY